MQWRPLPYAVPMPRLPRAQSFVGNADDLAIVRTLEQHAGRFEHLDSLSLDNDRWNDDVCMSLKRLLACVELRYPVPADAGPLVGLLSAEYRELTVDCMELSVATAAALENAGIASAFDLAKMSPAQLVAHGLRRRSVKELTDILSGMTTASEAQ